MGRQRRLDFQNLRRNWGDNIERNKGRREEKFLCLFGPWSKDDLEILQEQFRGRF